MAVKICFAWALVLGQGHLKVNESQLKTAVSFNFFSKLTDAKLLLLCINIIYNDDLTEKKYKQGFGFLFLSLSCLFDLSV